MLIICVNRNGDMVSFIEDYTMSIMKDALLRFGGIINSKKQRWEPMKVIAVSLA